MRRIKLTIAYDGTAYAGWQRQENGTAVQAVIEDVIEGQFHEKVHLQGSGRTDAGVHARGQVAAFSLEHPIPADKLLLALNANLPEDIRILNCREADPDFHPQFDAKRKTYVYRIFNGKVLLPQWRNTTWLVTDGLEEAPMREVLKMLEGEHDFHAFRSSKAVNASTVRTVYEATLRVISEEREPGGTLYELSVTGNGFLYNMVRIIAGTVVEAGRGKISPEDVKRALETGDRELLGPTAPAHGLTLDRVEYTGQDEAEPVSASMQ
ncbi:MAG: tRNA pseudouridine(38-40) synthase TruA [Lachnospiraceae bacterium]|nr:tRNA pseudouridine(38-40) synthase TruA [Lachnospiraceae bacterium]